MTDQERLVRYARVFDVCGWPDPNLCFVYDDESDDYVVHEPGSLRISRDWLREKLVEAGRGVYALENGACFVSKMTLCSDYDEALLAAGEDMFVKEKE